MFTDYHPALGDIPVRSGFLERLALKWRVLIWITFVNLLVMFGAGAVLILNARSAVEVEITAAQDSAMTILRRMSSELPEASDESALAILAQTIVQPRHVRIRIRPREGEALYPVNSMAEEEDEEGESPPAFFIALVSPAISTGTIPVMAGKIALAPSRCRQFPRMKSPRSGRMCAIWRWSG